MHNLFRAAVATLRRFTRAPAQRQSPSMEWLACARAIKSALASGDYAAAQQIVAHSRSTVEPVSDIGYLVFLNNAALAYSEAGQFDKGIGIKREALELATEIFPPTDPEVVEARLGLAVVYLDADNFAAALPQLMAANSVANDPAFPNRGLALRVKGTLASAHDDLGDIATALPLARSVLSGAQALHMSDLELSSFQIELALMLRKTRDRDAALPLLLAAYQSRKAAMPSGDQGVAHAAHNLGLAYLDSGALPDAKRVVAEAYDWRLKHLGGSHPATVRSLELVKLAEEGGGIAT